MIFIPPDCVVWKKIIGIVLCALTWSGDLYGQTSQGSWDDSQLVTRPWTDIQDTAHGQTVYWHAWGGKSEINAYMGWVAQQTADRYGVIVKHVKLDNTATAIAQVISEKTAGNTTKGSVDLLWANGENFAILKKQGLLFGPWTQHLPNYAFVATDKPSTQIDFGEPVAHMEAPYGMAQLVFAYNPKRLPVPPPDVSGLLEWAQAHPGRFTYPTPENWIGATFLKQILVEMSSDPDQLYQPVDTVDFNQITQHLWAYLDRLHPVMWRSGTDFPVDEVQQRQMLADNQIDVSLTFGAGETSSAIAQGILPDFIRTFVFQNGTIGNTNFVSIPFNATAKAGAMVVANFLLSPEAQARKQDPDIWGATTVLDPDLLPPHQKALFTDLPRGLATLPLTKLGPPLNEPHFSWGPALTQAWLNRYRGS